MNFIHKYILLIKHSFLLLVVISMFSQACVNSLALNTDYNLEIVETNSEDDSDKEERVENDAETKKSELQVTIAHSCVFTNLLKTENFKILHFFSNFKLKIPLPPPDVV